MKKIFMFTVFLASMLIYNSSHSQNEATDTKISGWKNLKWGDSLDIIKEKYPVLKSKSYDDLTLSDSILNIDFHVLLYLDSNKLLNSVFLGYKSEYSFLEDIKNYFNKNYFEGNEIEKESGNFLSGSYTKIGYKWTGTHGDILLTETEVGRIDFDNYETSRTIKSYIVKITFSKASIDFTEIKQGDKLKSEKKSSLTTDQKFDMLRNEIIRMKNEETEIKLNLYNCHQEYKVGVGLFGTGLGLGVLGTVLVMANPTVGSVVAVVGGSLSLAGTIVILDSHKFIGRASLTGMTFSFKNNTYNITQNVKGIRPIYRKIQPGDNFLHMGQNN